MEEQTLIQKKIALAQSEHHSMIIELMRDITTKTPIIGDTEYKTLLNAITLEVEANMMIRMADYLEKIRKGQLHEPK
jgi:hypothetical protein